MATAISPRVCISVLNWNNAEQTICCLHSLSTLDYPNYNVIVVDNASCDESVEQIHAAFPDLEIIVSETNVGYAAGNALALERALADGETELFWILNNDTTALPDTLNQLVAAYEIFGEALYGGVALQSTDDPEGWKLHLMLWDYRPDGRTLFLRNLHDLAYQTYFADSTARIVTSLHGSSLMMPLTVVRRAGFMDMAFFLYSEESDYCLRLGKQGIKSVLVPKSVIVHGRGGSRRGRARLHLVISYYQIRNRLILFRRHSTGISYLRLLLQTVYRAVVAMIQSFIGRREKALESRYIFRAVYDELRRRTGKTLTPEDFLDAPSVSHQEEAVS